MKKADIKDGIEVTIRHYDRALRSKKKGKSLPTTGIIIGEAFPDNPEVRRPVWRVPIRLDDGVEKDYPISRVIPTQLIREGKF